jgi:hypothetical protein
MRRKAPDVKTRDAVWSLAINYPVGKGKVISGGDEGTENSDAVAR